MPHVPRAWDGPTWPHAADLTGAGAGRAHCPSDLCRQAQPARLTGAGSSAQLRNTGQGLDRKNARAGTRGPMWDRQLTRLGPVSTDRAKLRTKVGLRELLGNFEFPSLFYSFRSKDRSRCSGSAGRSGVSCLSHWPLVPALAFSVQPLPCVAQLLRTTGPLLYARAV